MPTQTPTVTSTPTATHYPTFVPAVTPTLAWPTPAPSAFFFSRYLAIVFDPTPAAGGAGALRGRVLDWRGIGQANFRVHALGQQVQAEGVSGGDGQYSITGLPPGSYEVRLLDFQSEPAGGIPVVAGQITTLDWIEALRGPGPAPAVIIPTLALPPTFTATPVPANLIQRPTSSPARPSPPELALLEVVALAAEQLWNAFLTGVAVVAIAAVLMIAWSRRRAGGGPPPPRRRW